MSEPTSPRKAKHYSLPELIGTVNLVNYAADPETPDHLRVDRVGPRGWVPLDVAGSYLQRTEPAIRNLIYANPEFGCRIGEQAYIKLEYLEQLKANPPRRGRPRAQT